MAVLREVKYLGFQQQKEIPRSAESLFSQRETFRKFVGNLELIVGWYNEVSRGRFISFYLPSSGFCLAQTRAEGPPRATEKVSTFSVSGGGSSPPGAAVMVTDASAELRLLFCLGDCSEGLHCPSLCLLWVTSESSH